MKQLVLVLGAGGQLGEAMAEQLAVRHEVAACTRQELDVTDPARLREGVTSVYPDVIVNCAAYTNVDRAESEPTAALAVNAWAVRSLARLATEIDATLIHYSTDFVFDGTVDRPYVETDPPNPQNTYAMTKLLGEWFAAGTPRHYVLRVESLFGAPRGHSTIDRMAATLRAGGSVRAFSDRTVSPTAVDDIVEATAAIIATAPPPGVYHCVDSGWDTWEGVALEVARLVGAPRSAVQPITTAEAALAVRRPTFAALSNARLASVGIVMPSWRTSLARALTRLEP